MELEFLLTSWERIIYLYSLYRNNSRLSFMHADAFDPLHVESFALRELYLSGCELNYLPEDLLPGSQNWAALEVIGEWGIMGGVYPAFSQNSGPPRRPGQRPSTGE